MRSERPDLTPYIVNCSTSAPAGWPFQVIFIVLRPKQPACIRQDRCARSPGSGCTRNRMATGYTTSKRLGIVATEIVGGGPENMWVFQGYRVACRAEKR